MKKFHFLGVRKQPIIQAFVQLSAWAADQYPRAPVPGVARADETRYDNHQASLHCADIT